MVSFTSFSRKCKVVVGTTLFVITSSYLASLYIPENLPKQLKKSSNAN